MRCDLCRSILFDFVSCKVSSSRCDCRKLSLNTNCLYRVVLKRHILIHHIDVNLQDDGLHVLQKKMMIG